MTGTNSSTESSEATTGDQRSAIDELKDRFIEMIDQGCTRFGWTVGPKWYDLTIEEKAKAILEMCNAPRTGDGTPTTGKPSIELRKLVAEFNEAAANPFGKP